MPTLVSACCKAEMNVTREPNQGAIAGYTLMYDCKACGKACATEFENPPCPLGICDGSGVITKNAGMCGGCETCGSTEETQEPCPHLNN